MSTSGLAIRVAGTPRLVALHRVGGSGQIDAVMWIEESIRTTADGVIAFQYNAPRPSIPPGGSHCSDVRVHFYLDDRLVHTSPWLGYEGRTPALPLASELVVVRGMTSGTHRLRLQPEGRPGGCNPGNLFAWDGTLLVFE